MSDHEALSAQILINAERDCVIKDVVDTLVNWFVRRGCRTQLLDLIKDRKEPIVTLMSYTETRLVGVDPKTIYAPALKTYAAIAAPCRTRVGDVLGDHVSNVPLHSIMSGPYGVILLLQEKLPLHYKVTWSITRLLETEGFNVEEYSIEVSFSSRPRQPNEWIRKAFPDFAATQITECGYRIPTVTKDTQIESVRQLFSEHRNRERMSDFHGVGTHVLMPVGYSTEYVRGIVVPSPSDSEDSEDLHIQNSVTKEYESWPRNALLIGDEEAEDREVDKLCYTCGSVGYSLSCAEETPSLVKDMTCNSCGGLSERAGQECQYCEMANGSDWE
jgi:hypothetical protein